VETEKLGQKEKKLENGIYRSKQDVCACVGVGLSAVGKAVWWPQAERKVTEVFLQ